MQRILEKKHFRNKQKEIEYISKKLQSYDWKTYPHRCLLILDDFASHPLLKNREQDMFEFLRSSDTLTSQLSFVYRQQRV
ncbi:hypothetical protein TVAG_531530 [Trichomonas vaginalis G3]|uniref:Uncharacterized protein n=1 Tax=Trichomonas vaginalis (strain ATCC PRA-98 / G3) TaxID=412133 RepID=A2HJV6_TRIV3|nr:protein of unknown function, DUF4106 family [Trichomonas vaginalis G3]EAX70311.1 hypothetical protein TVAG_531530 [Trichomonas vaginalis G3]KAI5504084.1 protein of unknown function, DUF4106 family [Trichomonas vaginalis G3]|eukprot:XP_001283241.1 hypothetical protein [Trichomonas vaginalis G3]